jgi:hypothetical protein
VAISEPYLCYSTPRVAYFVFSCSTDASSGDESEEGSPAGGARLTSREKLALADAIQNGSTQGVEDMLPCKGLFAMPFMRRALKLQGAQVAKEAQEVMDAEAAVAGLPDGGLMPSRQAFGRDATRFGRQRVTENSVSGSEDEDEDHNTSDRRKSIIEVEDKHAHLSPLAVPSTPTPQRSGARQALQNGLPSTVGTTSAASCRRGSTGGSDGSPVGKGGDGIVHASLPSAVLRVLSLSMQALSMSMSVWSCVRFGGPCREMGKCVLLAS